MKTLRLLHCRSYIEGGIALIALALIASAPAAGAQPTTLTIPRAKAAIRAADRIDHPVRVTFGACQRLSSTAIQCSVTEFGIVTDVMLNDQPIVGDLTLLETVRLRGARVTVSP